MNADQLPITEEDICHQVAAMGGEMTEDVSLLARAVAHKLQLHRVRRRTDGRRVDDEQLRKASAATKMLEELHAHASAVDRKMPNGVPPQPHIAEAQEKVAPILQATLAVRAAIFTLLGNPDDPADDCSLE